MSSYCLDFKDRSVAIVGAGTGIGEGIARAFGMAGANLSLSYVGAEIGARDVADAARAAGQRSFVRDVDSRDLDGVRAFVDEVISTMSGLDVLVYNAGITDPHPVLQLSEDQWDQTMDINLKGMFFCCQRAAMHLKRLERSASFVLVSSVQSVRAIPGHAHYAASKSAINMLTRVLALELAPDAIRVNAVAPGAIYVDRIKKLNAYDPSDMARHIPLHRVGTPDDIAHAALFLASPYASYISGHVLVVDGGLTLPLAIPSALPGVEG